MLNGWRVVLFSRSHNVTFPNSVWERRSRSSASFPVQDEKQSFSPECSRAELGNEEKNLASIDAHVQSNRWVQLLSDSDFRGKYDSSHSQLSSYSRFHLCVSESLAQAIGSCQAVSGH